MSSNDYEDAESGGRRAYWLGSLAALLLFAFAAVWWPGCREYPAVSSKESLGLLRALHTAVNTKDERRLNQVMQKYQELVQSGLVSVAEQSAYEKLFESARAGDWAAAERGVTKMLEDQVGLGSTKLR